MKDLAAFANTLGGDLYLGVDDQGALVGVEEPDRLIEQVISAARDNIYPSIIPLLSFRRIQENGKTAVVVHVTAGPDKPYFTDSADISSIYVRAGSFSMTASRERVARFVAEANSTAWENRVSLNQELTFDFCRAFSLSRGLNFNPLEDFSYGFIDPASRELTNLAFLCSDQNSFKIVASAFFDDDKSQMLKSKAFSGSILRNLKEAENFILEQCLLKMEKPKDGRLERRNCYSVAPDAVREALVNMIAHRDYTRVPPCVVHITPSQVMFFSVGGPVDLTEEEIFLQMATNCRNIRLANFLKTLHLLEGTGSGFSTIRKAYDNIPFRWLIQVFDTSFLISLPRNKQKSTEESKAAAETQREDSLSEKEELVEFIKVRKGSTRNDVEEHFHFSRSKAGYWLKKLVDEGVLKRNGAGRRISYSLVE